MLKTIDKSKKKKKTGGRVKGCPNKLTHQTRQVLANIVEGELERIPAILLTLEPAARIEIVLRMCNYLLPKVESISVKDLDAATLDGEQYVKEITERVEDNRKRTAFGLGSLK